MMTHEELKELLDYDPDTGIFVWNETRSRCAMKGSTAGTINHHGRLVIKIRGKVYAAHRLAWLYVTGKWPHEEIDHIDHNPLNNKFSNLRQATRQQNSMNQKLSVKNTSGYKGVTWDKRKHKWAAYVMHNQKYVFLGYFDEKEKAGDTADKKRKELFGEYHAIQMMEEENGQ